MARRRHRTLALALALTVGAALLAPPVQAGEPPADELARLRSADAELEDELARLEAWLVDGQAQLADLEIRIREAEQAIVRAEARAEEAARRAEVQQLQVEDRAVAAYVRPMRTAAVTLSSDVNEAAEQSLLVEQVTAHDRELLEAKREAEERLEREQADAEAARDDLADTEAEVTDLLDQLFAQRDEAVVARAALDRRIAEVQAEVDAMAVSSGSLVDLINRRSGADGGPVGALTIPVNGTLTSRFGPRWGRLHAGIDVAAPTGTPIRSAAAGRTIYGGWMSGYGNVVIVDHGGGLSTLYAHQSQRLAVVGELLRKGQILGLVGSTGNSTGAHLHFEVRERGVPTDPIPYLTA